MTDPCEKIYMNGFQRRAQIQRQSSRYRSSPFTKLGWEFKGTVSRDFLLLVFFHESVSSKPLIIPLGLFRIFSKIHGDIRSSKFATGVRMTVNLLICDRDYSVSTPWSTMVGNLRQKYYSEEDGTMVCSGGIFDVPRNRKLTELSKP